MKSDWYMRLKLLTISCCAVNFAWRCWPIVEFETTSNFSRALLQVDLKQHYRPLSGLNIVNIYMPVISWCHPGGVCACVHSFLYLSSLKSSGSYCWFWHETLYWAHIECDVPTTPQLEKQVPSVTLLSTRHLSTTLCLSSTPPISSSVCGRYEVTRGVFVYL